MISEVSCAHYFLVYMFPLLQQSVYLGKFLCQCEQVVSGHERDLCLHEQVVCLHGLDLCLREQVVCLDGQDLCLHKQVVCLHGWALRLHEQVVCLHREFRTLMNIFKYTLTNSIPDLRIIYQSLLMVHIILVLARELFEISRYEDGFEISFYEGGFTCVWTLTYDVFRHLQHMISSHYMGWIA